MKTTNSKDLVKDNQILPIMQEHFGKTMNLARRQLQPGGALEDSGTVHPSFRADSIDCLVADREFIGKEWIGWLNDRRIRYYIRIRQNFWIIKSSTGERIRAWWLFNDLRVDQEKLFHKLL